MNKKSKKESLRDKFVDYINTYSEGIDVSNGFMDVCGCDPGYDIKTDGIHMLDSRQIIPYTDTQEIDKILKSFKDDEDFREFVKISKTWTEYLNGKQ